MKEKIELTQEQSEGIKSDKEERTRLCKEVLMDEKRKKEEKIKVKPKK